MYQFLKKIVLVIFPKSIIWKYELFFRKIIAFFYNGNSVYCSVCHGNFSRFIILKNENLICPQCASLPRNRMMAVLLDNKYFDDKLILEFSPSRCMYYKYKKKWINTYFTTDFAQEFIADFKFDITKMPDKDNTYDIINCLHVLEHITDDIKAMQELYRVIKIGGQIYLQTPFKEGTIYENDLILSDVEREKHFGQKDHVRVYSLQGLLERLQKAGFSTEVIRASNLNISTKKMGITAHEIIVKAIKN